MANWYGFIYSCKLLCAVPLATSDFYVGGCASQPYANTASIITMPPATFTAAPSSMTNGVDGWFNTQDTAGGVVTVSGCTYPDEYNGIFSVIPTAPCTGPTATPTDI